MSRFRFGAPEKTRGKGYFSDRLLVAYWGYIEFWVKFWVWVYGPHGPALYMVLGGIGCLVLLIIRSALSVGIKRYGSRARPPKGFLDYTNDAEVAMSELPAITSTLTAVTEEVGISINRHTVTLMQAAGSTNHQLRVMKHAAGQLDRHSARIDAIGMTFTKTGRSLSDGLIGWSRWLKDVRPDKATLGAQFPETLRGFVVTLDTNNNQLQTYISTMRGIKGAARTMDAALDRHIRSLQVILDTNINIHAACSQMLSVIDGLA
jgi:hypothetical protein